MKKLISGIRARLLNKLGENKYRALMQFVRFCLVGALNTLVDYGVFVLSYNVIFGRNDSLDFIAVGLGWCAGGWGGRWGGRAAWAPGGGARR